MQPPSSPQTSPPSPVMTSHSPSLTTVACKRSKTLSKEALNPSFADLPLCLLEVIMSLLVLEDNIRASAACKSWREAAVSVRVVERHPWLMYFPKRSNSFILCDPLQWKTYTLNLPELAESTVCYSRDGWLLMRRSSSNDMFFFNPFSRELISLPKFELSFLEIAFSCPPTADNCVVIALDYDEGRYQILISTCHPGATEWITEDIPAVLPFYMQSKLVYLNDRFYCFNSGGLELCSFNPSSRTWKSLSPTYMIMGPYKQWSSNPKAVFLAEKKAELFVMLTSGNDKPLVYKLVSLEWEMMSHTELDGLTIFVSFYNSELRNNLPWMRNNVYFSRFGYNRKRCVSYSFDESRYNTPKEWYNWLELCPPQSIWINPPKNVLDYL